MILPSPLALRHGFPGRDFCELSNLRLPQLRPCVSEDPLRLGRALLDAIGRARRDAQPNGAIAPFFERLPVDGVFLGLLAEYLWSETPIGRRTGKCVYAYECLPEENQAIIIRKEPVYATEWGITCERYTVESQEPLLFRLMRTSRSVAQSVVVGIKHRRRVLDAEHAAPPEWFVSSIFGSVKQRFPSIWASTRRLQLMRSSPEEDERGAQVCASLERVRLRRDAVERTRRAEELAVKKGLKRCADEPTDHFTWRLSQVWGAVRAAFGDARTILSEVAMTWEDLSGAVAGSGVTEEVLTAAVPLLEEANFVFMSGDLVFLLRDSP